MCDAYTCTGRMRGRLQYCQGFLDINGRWNNGFFCRRRSTTQSIRASSSVRLAADTGCCGIETYRFCCDDAMSSFHRQHNPVTLSSASTTTAASVDKVHRHQLVRSVECIDAAYYTKKQSKISSPNRLHGLTAIFPISRV